MKIGVFDSGVGGVSVARAIQEALPEHEVLIVSDAANAPYGIKQPPELLNLVEPLLEGLVDQGCQVIVIACNTVGTTLIEQLRQIFAVQLVTMEPMVKPAAELSKSKVIAVCATPTTLASKRYAWLKQTYAQGIEVIEPDCSDWAYMIENKQVDRQQIHDRIEAACRAGTDVIVLGCTHYHWIEDVIQDTAGERAIVLQPEVPVIKELKRVLARFS
jgi:glutamate racemase